MTQITECIKRQLGMPGLAARLAADQRGDNNNQGNNNRTSAGGTATAG